MARHRNRRSGARKRPARWEWFALCAVLAAGLPPVTAQGAATEDLPAPSPSGQDTAAPASPAPPEADAGTQAAPEKAETDASAKEADAPKPEAAEAKQEETKKQEAGEKEEAKEPEETDPLAPSPYHNWVDFSFGGITVHGDSPQFQHHQQFDKGVFGGIEDFHYERRVSKKGSFQVDGHGIFDQNNYKLSLEYVQQDLGFIRGGLSKYRTWYDGHGGFFPQNQQWFDLYDNELATDRGNFWIEAGLLKENWPEFRLKYQYDYREGEKDSTVWGDSTLTAGAGTRSFVPSFWGIQERRHTLGLSAKKAVGKTELDAAVNLQRDNNDNALYLRRQPGEGASDRSVTQKNGTDADMLSAHASSHTRFNANTMLTAGYSFTVLESDLSGERVYGAGYDPIYDPTFLRRPTDVGYVGLNGGSDLKQHVFSLNLLSSPVTNLFLTPSIRVEKRDVTSFSSFLATGAAQQEQPAWGEGADGLIEVSERLEAKYLGVTNWVLYARGDWNQGQGNLKEALIDNAPSPLLAPFRRDTDYSRLVQKYTAGANWYPLRRLNIDLQYYHKIRDTEYDHFTDTTDNTSANRYPAYFNDQNFTTDDANIRATVRALPNLTFVSRYDFQYSTLGSQPGQLASVESGRVTSHVFSQSITWMPWNRLYLQPSLTYVIDRTETPASDLSGAATGLVSESRNDYWDGGLTAGYALSAKTDLQAHYFFYYSDNYVDDSAVTMPYGAAATEHGVTVALIHRFSPRLRGMVKYGFFTNRDQTSGYHNDYDAHLVYTSLQYRF